VGESSYGNDDRSCYGLQDGIMHAGYFAGVNESCCIPIRRRRMIRIPRQVAELSEGLESEISEYEMEEEDATNVGDLVTEGIKHAYRDETWSQSFFTYEPKPRGFVGRRGTVQFFHNLPTILQLFDLFWPSTVSRKIVIETNHYATMVLDALGTLGGGGVNRRI
jgi:hypothetical protein